MEEALRSVGVVVWPMVEFEADDALTTGAARWADAPDVERVVILSPDKDMAQCVREDGRVVTYNRRLRQLIDAGAVRAKFGVSPASIPDYLALVGDSSDGFPGLPGWGARSAALVLARYGHLEAIPAEASRWDVRVTSAPVLAATLRQHWDLALLFRELATLSVEVPLPESLDDLRWQGVPREDFDATVALLGARHLYGLVPRWSNTDRATAIASSRA